MSRWDVVLDEGERNRQREKTRRLGETASDRSGLPVELAGEDTLATRVAFKGRLPPLVGVTGRRDSDHVDVQITALGTHSGERYTPPCHIISY